MQPQAVALANYSEYPSSVVAVAPFALADEHYAAVKTRLTSAEAGAMSHSDLERLLEVEGHELMRRLLQDHLRLRAQQERELGVHGPVVGCDGVVRTHLRDSERGLMTVFGDVDIERLAHHAPGSESLRPLDAALNLPAESFSFGVRRRVAEEAIRGSFDEALAAIVAHTGARLSKRQLEELAIRAATDFEPFYVTRQELPPAAVAELSDLLVITTDGKGVVMRRSALRAATRKAAERARHKLKRRLTKGEKKNRKRMAQVAAVYTVAPFYRTPEDIMRELDRKDETPTPRPRPEQKRVWASVRDEAEEVVRAAFAEAAWRDPQRRKTWVALSDGNETQLELLEQLAREYGVKLIIVLDLIHVTEYLWKATTVFNDEASPEAEAWVTERLLPILRGKARNVAAGVRRSATLRGLSRKERKAADTCADYLLKYTKYLHYNEYLAAGLPIATGVIEGACRHLVKDRMDITGARWGLAGAEAILKLRALRSSGDFAEYWAFHEQQEWARNHAERYANGAVPALRQPGPRGRPRLTLVK